MGPMVSPRDRVLRRVAGAVARCFFRTVEVVGPRTDRGPVIVAASHLNGFVDPVLLVTALGRLPRFLAKGTLWRIAPARPFLALVRLIPVHRRQDSDGDVSNTAAFASAIWYASGPLLPSRPQWKKGMTRAACVFAAATSSRTIFSTTVQSLG